MHKKLEFNKISPMEMQQRSRDFLATMQCRRSVREFAERPVPRNIIENCLRVAGTAPSGANCQPWHFVAISDPAIKGRIRIAAEKVEKDFYTRPGTARWVADLAPLGTHPSKPFLAQAPYLIAIFAERYGELPDGRRQKHYYVVESVGIATGMLITALHYAGLACLTYTPVNMGFLNKILTRPANEKPFMILAAGYPAEKALVPDIQKKPAERIITYI